MQNKQLQKRKKQISITYARQVVTRWKQGTGEVNYKGCE